MESPDVLFILDVLASAEVPPVIDGGWGVDALLERQTRSHADLDVAIDRALLDLAERALSEKGFAPDPSAAPGLPARLVMHDDVSRRVDLHPLDFDAAGNGWQRLSQRGWGFYPSADVMASGRIEGRRVRCISPDLQLRHHLGYDWKQHDVHDMRLLSERFGIPLPPLVENG